MLGQHQRTSVHNGMPKRRSCQRTAQTNVFGCHDLFESAEEQSLEMSDVPRLLPRTAMALPW